MKLPEPFAHAVRRTMRYRHLRTVAEIVGAVVLISGGAAAAASAAPGVTGSAIHGCENSKTGALSVQLKASCPKGTKALSWNVKGPRGPAGTAALFGTKTNQAALGTSGGTCTLGQVILTAGHTAPAGTMPADGQVLSIASNTALFSLLTTEYGGNGTSTFALPNLSKSAPDGLTYSICVEGIFP